MDIISPSFIKEKLSGLEFKRVRDERMKASAVLVPLFEKGGRTRLLFTRRTEKVPTHKGQISFPGGRRDPEDENTLGTALRETQEELGIERSDIKILGRLDEIITITRFCISPHVGWIPYPYDFRVSEDEIAEVIELPLEGFLDPGIFRKEAGWQMEGRPYPVYFFNVGGYNVWGATARILKQFLEVVCGWEEPL